MFRLFFWALKGCCGVEFGILTFPSLSQNSGELCWPLRLGGMNQKQRLRNSGCGERKEIMAIHLIPKI